VGDICAGAGCEGAQLPVHFQPPQVNPESARYDFRVFAVINLGLMGDEFKTVRANLLRFMPGDSSYKRGRKIGKLEASKCAG
jgi:hypothetical protein